MYELITWLKDTITAQRVQFESYLFEQLDTDASNIMLQKFDEDGIRITTDDPKNVAGNPNFRYEMTGNENDIQLNLKTILNQLRDFEQALDSISKTQLTDPNTWLQGLWGGLSLGFSIAVTVTQLLSLWPYVATFVFAMAENYHPEAGLGDKIYQAINSFFGYFPLFGIQANAAIEENVKNTQPNAAPQPTATDNGYQQIKNELYQFHIRYQKLSDSKLPWVAAIQMGTFQHLIKALINANKLLAEDQNGTLREIITTTLTAAINACEYTINQVETLGFKQKTIEQYKNILGALKHIQDNLKVGTVAQTVGTALNLVVALDTQDPEKLAKVNLALSQSISSIDTILASNKPGVEMTTQLLPLVTSIYQLTGDPELLLNTLKKDIQLSTEQVKNLTNILIKLNAYNGQMTCFFDEAKEGTLSYTQQTLANIAQTLGKQSNISQYLDLAANLYGTQVAGLIKDTGERAPYYQTRIAAAEKRLEKHPKNQQIKETLQELKNQFANSILKNFTGSLEENYKTTRDTLGLTSWKKAHANKTENKQRTLQINFLNDVAAELQKRTDLPAHIKLYVYQECLTQIKNEIRSEKNFFNSALDKIVTDQAEAISKNPTLPKTADLSLTDTKLIKATFEQLRSPSAQSAPTLDDTNKSVVPSPRR